jgi:hypothetical protein
MPQLLLLRQTLPAQAHRPAVRRQRQQQEQAQAPNPSLRPLPQPNAHNGKAQIPKARLRPTSSPMEQRMPNVHCDMAPNPQRLHSESRRARTPDRRATYHDRRGLRSRSHPAKHTATIRTCLHAGHVPRPIPQSYRAAAVAARRSSLGPFRRKCIADRAQRYKPGHPQLLQPRRLPRTPCWCCHPRLHQHDICPAAELKKPDSEYQSRSFRYFRDAAPVETRSLAPLESEPHHPSNSETKQPSPMRDEVPRLPDVTHPASPDLPTADLP